jgi:hypothetical protein
MSEAAILISKLVSIFAWAFLSFWTSIPGGIALSVPPLLVGITAWVSYSVGVIATVLLGEPVRAWVMQRFGSKMTANPDSLFQRVWSRFGLLGLSLLAPMTTGSQIGAALGLTLGVPRRRLVIGMIMGGAIWAALITAAVTLGLMGAQSIR